MNDDTAPSALSPHPFPFIFHPSSFILAVVSKGAARALPLPGPLPGD